MTRFTNRLRVLLTGLALLGLSRPVAAETQLVFSTPPGGAVFPLEGVYVPQRAAIVYSSALAFPFYLTRAGSSTPLEIDVRAFRQIRVFSSQQGGAIVATLEVWENGEPI